jgi:GNAT superfamily N-acetyltransferase
VSVGREPWLTIRTATDADLDALRQVYRTASLSNAGDAPTLLARPEYLVFAGDGVASGHTRVAVADGQVVGFVTIVEADDGPELEDLFVSPDWHRRGVARRLVEDVVATLREAGHPRLWVTGNPHALQFYLAVGFAETGPVATEFGSGLRMCLDLTHS